MITKIQAKRLAKVCRGDEPPITDEEKYARQGYVLRMDGYALGDILDKLNPPIFKAGEEDLRFLLLGLAFAEHDIVDMDIDVILEENDEEDDEKIYH